MKRGIEGGEAHHSPPRARVDTDTPQEPVEPETPQAPPGRSRSDGVHLDSLMQPIPNRPDRQVAQVLTEYAEYVKRKEGRAAVQLIFQLDREDRVDGFNDEIFQLATDLLLRLGQIQLLQRLALLRPVPYVLDVRANRAKAQAMNSLAAVWPAQVPVTLKLWTSLGQDIDALMGFLNVPQALSVEITVDVGLHAPTTTAWADALGPRHRGRPLKALCVEVGPAALTLLQALHASRPGQGVQAQRVRFSMLPNMVAGPVGDIEAAMVQLTIASGAKELDASDPSIGGPLAADLMNCKKIWETVHVCNAFEAYRLLRKDGFKIARLELYQKLPAAATLMPSAGFLRVMQALSLRALVVHGHMSLAHFVQALQAHMPTQMASTLCDSVDACLVFPKDADIGPYLNLLGRKRWVGSMTHHPMDNVKPGWRALSPEEAGQLASMAIAFRQEAATPVVVAMPRAAHEVRDEALQMLARLLDPDLSLQEVLVLLASSTNPLIPATRLSPPAESQADAKGDLRSTVHVLRQAKVQHDLLLAALSALLRTRPHMARAMCFALIIGELPQRALSAAQWQAMAERFKRVSLSEGWTVPAGAATTSPEKPRELGGFTMGRFAKPTAGALQALGDAQGGKKGARNTFMGSLVLPPGDDNVVKLNASLSTRAASLGKTPHDAAVREALKEIGNWLRKDAMDERVLRQLLRHEIANQLLQEGQWKLLQRMMQTQVSWSLTLATEQQATALQALTPPTACACELEVACELSETALKGVSAFIGRLHPERRVLNVVARPGEHRPVWQSRAALVRMTRGITLALLLPPARDGRMDEVALTGWLLGIQRAEMYELRLQGEGLDKPSSLELLKQLIRATNVRALRLQDTSDELTQALLTCKPWERLDVSASDTVADVFRSGAVAARRLTLSLPRTANVQQSAETIVGTCRQLEALRIQGAHMDLLRLVRALDIQQTTHTLATALSAVNGTQVAQALEMLTRNAVLSSIEQLNLPGRQGVSPIRAQVWNRLLTAATRNRLAPASAKGIGALARMIESAMAVQVPEGFKSYLHPFDDIGRLVRPHLNDRSARALAVVSKAAYIGSTQAWESHIALLRKLLHPSLSYFDFAKAVQDRIVAGEFVGEAPHGPYFENQTPARLVLEKLHDLLDANVPSEHLAEAVGRMLHADPDAAPVWLQALAYLSVFPAQEWLEQVLGVGP